MAFGIVCMIALAALAVLAGVANYFDSGDDTIETGHDCSTCTAADEGTCKIHCLIEEKRKRESEEENS
jgi:hypothetical protein